MALSNIAEWNDEKKTAAACGTACGASDNTKEKSAACKTACRASDNTEEKSTSCGA
jgi:ACGX-repeat protein